MYRYQVTDRGGGYSRYTIHWIVVIYKPGVLYSIIYWKPTVTQKPNQRTGEDPVSVGHGDFMEELCEVGVGYGAPKVYDCLTFCWNLAQIFIFTRKGEKYIP